MGSPSTDTMTSAKAGRQAEIFPLPLSPFEKFILWDERPLQPMTFFIELHLESELDLERLTDAVMQAIHRNPLLASRVEEQQGRLVWVYQPDTTPAILSGEDVTPVQNGKLSAIDLTKECGLRFWYFPASHGGSRLLMQMHHACCDGVGARNFLIEIFASYAASFPGAQPSRLAQVMSLRDSSSLQHRFDFSGKFEGEAAKKLTAWQRLKNAYYFHFQPPQSLRSKAAVGEISEASVKHSASSNLHPLQHVIVDRQLSRQIVEKTRRQSLTLNEVALSLLFRTCHQWNRQSQDVARNRLRLLMPYDLRSVASDRRMPAANRLSFCFMGRTYAQCEDLSSLVRSVRDEIEEIRETRLPLDFLEALRVCDTRPQLAKWVIAHNRNMATAVLTQAGEVMRAISKIFPAAGRARVAGDALVTNILGAPPPRENTNMAIGLCLNWGQLCMSANWNREAFTQDDCHDFLELYRQQWMDWHDAP